MAELHTIVAIVNRRKKVTQEDLSRVYQRSKKDVLYDGSVRAYEPLREDEHELPPETKLVQLRWAEELQRAIALWTPKIDLVATMDNTNCVARGDIKIDGVVVAPQVPVTHLMFLEKDLMDVRTFIKNLPVLTTDEEWSYDPNKDCFVTEEQRKVRTRKVPKVLVKMEPTEFQPAQTERYDVDLVVGEFQTVLMSGRIPQQKKTELLGRVDRLIEAVNTARVEANKTKVAKLHIAMPMFDYVMNGLSAVMPPEPAE